MSPRTSLCAAPRPPGPPAGCPASSVCSCVPRERAGEPGACAGSPFIRSPICPMSLNAPYDTSRALCCPPEDTVVPSPGCPLRPRAWVSSPVTSSQGRARGAVGAVGLGSPLGSSACLFSAPVGPVSWDGPRPPDSQGASSETTCLVGPASVPCPASPGALLGVPGPRVSVLFWET